MVGVKKAVVVDALALAENPLAVGAVVSLGRLTLDLISKRVLTLVDSRQVIIFQNEHSGAGQDRRQQDGHDNPVQTYSRCLDRGDLICLGQKSKVYKGCH